MRAPTPPLLLAGLVACGGPHAGAGSSFGVGSGPGGALESTGGASSGTPVSPGSSSGSVPEDSSASDPGTSSTTGLLHDVGGADLGELHPKGCKGKIDFLFVIARLELAAEYQARLIEAFPQFMTTIESRFADFDYHIMVVDGDDYWGWPTCTSDCPTLDCAVGEPCCPIPPHCVNDKCWKLGDPCCHLDDYPCDLVAHLAECDQTMGAGIVFNAGAQASNSLCGVSGGRRYLTREQPQLPETFACIAQVGNNGLDNLGEALAAAVSPELNSPGGCNEGFLRDDALLMVTFIYGTVDTHSAGKPKLWADAVLAAKNGDPNAAIMFSIAPPACPPEDRICDLVKYYFPRWHTADLDSPDYGPAFETPSDLIVEACTQFIPQ